MGKKDYGDLHEEVNLDLDNFENQCIDRCANATKTTALPHCVTQERTRLNEPGPCGLKLSIQINPEVEIAYVTIPRRAHMRRRSAVAGREGTGHDPVPSKEMPEREKWHKLCLAIRDAGNLAIEMGSRRVSTNSLIPKCNKKAGFSGNFKPCIKDNPTIWWVTPVVGTDCQFISPVMW